MQNEVVGNPLYLLHRWKEVVLDFFRPVYALNIHIYICTNEIYKVSNLMKTSAALPGPGAD